MRQYTFIVGSTAEHDTTPDAVLDAVASLGYRGATAWAARGLWEGVKEPSVVVLIAFHDESVAPGVARSLARIFTQSAVYIADSSGRAWLEP